MIENTGELKEIKRRLQQYIETDIGNECKVKQCILYGIKKTVNKPAKQLAIFDKNTIRRNETLSLYLELKEFELSVERGI